jgi:hypothetical protein
VLLILATVSPLTFRCAAQPTSFEPQLLDVVLNLIGFLPLGIALRQRRWWVAVVIAIVLSGGLEILQRWQFRTSSVWDVAANVGGAWVGARLPDLWTKWIDTLTPNGRLAIPLTAAAIGFGAMLVEQKDSVPENTLDAWPATHVLTLGGEPDGSRAWSGAVHAFAVWDRVVGNPTPADADTPWLEGGPVLAATFGWQPQLTLDGPSRPRAIGAGVTPDRRGLVLDGTRPVRLPDEASDHLRSRLATTNEMTVSVRFTTSTPPRRQGRILTLSRDAHDRSFTVGWKNGHALFRVRTPGTGPNGRQPQVITHDSVLRKDGVVHLHATFDGAWSRLFVDGRCVGDALLPIMQAPVLVGNGLAFSAALLASLTAASVLAWLHGTGRHVPVRTLATAAGIGSWIALAQLGVWAHLPGWELRTSLPALLSIAAIWSFRRPRIVQIPRPAPV